MPATSSIIAARYQLGDRLGHGGMSEIYHGYDIRLGREVAVKIMRADRAKDPNFLEHFRREAQNAAILNHFAIVVVLDTGEADTASGVLPYIVMEYIDGWTLRDIVAANGPMKPQQAMDITVDICSALEFSHRNGIIHRDVKPANVMITKGSAVKVMDFGIAHAIRGDGTLRSEAGPILGTAEYVSPEHARGEAVDARSDVYAAGCVLYELITGRPPFTGNTASSVIYQHVREDAKFPSELNPAVSHALDAVVMKALSKGRSNRYQSAAEMRSDLLRVLAGWQPRAPRVMTEADRTEILNVGTSSSAYDDYGIPRPPRNRRRLPSKSLAVVVVGILLALWLTGSFRESESVVRIPGIVGQKYELAAKRLRDAGFEKIERKAVSCWRQKLSAKPPCRTDQIGKVIDLKPRPGTTVATSTPITVRVGIAPRRFPMPNLIGTRLSTVKQSLADRNLLLDPRLKAVITDDPSRIGLVAWQDPPSGTTVAEGRRITLGVFVGPEMADVVDYTGEQFGVARAGLTSAGFAVVRVFVDSAAPSGVVVGQDPAGGRAVKGSEIVLEVSNGAYTPIVMPDVTGKTEQRARDMLAMADHTGEIVIVLEEVSDYAQDGTVLRAEPRDGTRLARTDTVTLHIAEWDGSYTWSPTPTPSSTSEQPSSPPAPLPQAR